MNQFWRLSNYQLSLEDFLLVLLLFNFITVKVTRLASILSALRNIFSSAAEIDCILH